MSFNPDRSRINAEVLREREQEHEANAERHRELHAGDIDGERKPSAFGRALARVRAALAGRAAD
jgi:hypothetical protein